MDLNIKVFVITFFLSLSITSFSQEFNKRQIKKLNKFGIITSKYNLNDPKIQADFNKILKLRLKRDVNISLATSINTFSLVPIALGSYAMAIGIRDAQNGIRNEFALPLGIFFTTIGFIGGSTSIPFYIMYSRNIREKTKLLNTYKGF